MLVWDGHELPVDALAFAPEGGALATGDRSGRTLVRDPAGQVLFDRAGSGQGGITALIFKTGGHLLRAAGQLLATAPVAPWDAKKQTLVYTDFPQPISSLAPVSADSLAVGCGDRLRGGPGTFLVWNEETGRVREPRFLEPKGVRAVAAHPGGRLVAWANGSLRVTVWDTTKADQIFFNQMKNALSLSWHPDGVQLAATTDRLGKVFDVTNRREKLSLKGHSGLVTAVAFSPDGRLLVTGSWDGTVRTWDPATGAERERFDWGIGRVLCLAFDRDGQRLAAGGDKGTVAIWDV